MLPEEALRSGAADFVCIGEGEKCFVDLLEAMEHNRPLEGISGIWYKLDGDIIKNDPVPLTDLSDLPPPDFADFDPIHFYRPFDGKRYKMLNYELSRGCPFSCSYCVNGVLKQKYKGLGPYHRTKELRQSIEELRFLIGKYHFDFIRFWDEDFTSISQDYLLDYAEAYVAQIGLPFIIYARTDTVTVEKVRILKYMGCVTFAMGIESGNAFIRNRIMNRQMSNRMIEERFKLVKSFGIRVSAYNIIGLPYENRKRIFDTIELNKRIAPDSLSVTLLEPYKATPIRKICVEQGLDPLYDVVSDPTHPQFVPKKMSAGELSGLFRAFPFYVRFSKDRYGEIRRAETDKRLWRRLHREFSKFK